MLKKIVLCLLGLIGISVSANDGIKLLGVERTLVDGKMDEVKYYCKSGKVFVHLDSIGGKDDRMIIPLVWDPPISEGREDPQVLCSEFEFWVDSIADDNIQLVK